MSVARTFERQAADPASYASLSDAIEKLVEFKAQEVSTGRRSAGTLEAIKRHAGHWIRVVEMEKGEYRPLVLRKLTPELVDQYVAQRRDEGVRDHTISKELGTLRQVLKRAKRAGIWAGDVEAVLPIGFGPDYEPRKRYLVRAELDRVMAALPKHRAAMIAFAVATGARWGEVVAAQVGDIAADSQFVTLRGTKTAGSHRVVPIALPFQKELLAVAAAQARSNEVALFSAWSNVRRDLGEVVKKLGLTPLSPNDLRRTYGTWLREAGVPVEYVAILLGHTTTTLAERTYARLSPAAISELVTSTARECRSPGSTDTE
jgi:integrase